MAKLILFITLFIFSFESFYYTSDEIWESSKKQISANKYPQVYFTIDLNNYLDNNTIKEMLSTQKYIYNMYNIPNYVFFVSRLDLKTSSLERITFEISKKIKEEYNFINDRSIVVLFSINDRIFRIRTGAEIKNSILTNYMCEQILNRLKPFLRRANYPQVHRNLLIDIKDNLDFPEKYKSNFFKYFMLICSIILTIVVYVIISSCCYHIQYRKLNKIKDFLNNCKNNKKIPADICPICLDSLTNEESVALKCRHQFHNRCINLWFQKKSNCALCRTKIEINDLNKKYSLNDHDNSDYQNSLMDIMLRNLWDIQLTLNPDFQSMNYNDNFENRNNYNNHYSSSYDNDYSYSYSSYSNDYNNNDDHDYGGGASSSW